MKVVYYLFLFLAIVGKAGAQSEANDPGTRDTVALSYTFDILNQIDSTLRLEVWVFSDETVLSFYCEFNWSNPAIILDSAFESSHLRDENFSMFLYENDDLNTSNLHQKFQLGGFTTGDGLTGDSYTRRLWAVYYFSISGWQNGDSVKFDIVPDSGSQPEFVTSGPFYPISFNPVFDGPTKFPGLGTGIKDELQNIPSRFSLLQNYPNPFNPNTTIEFELERSSSIELSVYNLLGQRVYLIYQGRLGAGKHKFNWNAENNIETNVSSGVYFYRLQSENQFDTKKMLLLR